MFSMSPHLQNSLFSEAAFSAFFFSSSIFSSLGLFGSVIRHWERWNWKLYLFPNTSVGTRPGGSLPLRVHEQTAPSLYRTVHPWIKWEYRAIKYFF